MAQNNFRTSDIALASYLIIRGYSVADIVRDSGTRATFCFEDQPDRASQVLEFFNRQAVVEPLAFLDNVKSLKAMLSNR